MADISNSTHPDYDAMLSLWRKYRLTYEGGDAFIDEYLKQYSTRESATEFTTRREMSYCPAHAKASVNEIKNSIFQRTTDITRKDGPRSFLEAANGTDTRGMDLLGNTMNSFIGRCILGELLTMSKVGLFVDKPSIEFKTRKEQVGVRPYLYYYIAEDILNWSYDQNNILDILLLRDYSFNYDEDTGLPLEEVERYRLLKRTDSGVEVKFYNSDSVQVDIDGEISDRIYKLQIPEIPFVILEITSSLLTDVADYQKALLNLESSDISYVLKSNFPFYTEQYNPNTEFSHLLRSAENTLNTSSNATANAGTADAAAMSKEQEIKIGAKHGRRYPIGTDRPDYIHPSSEPILASMKKQSLLKQDIRELVNLNVASLQSKRASAESKAMDDRSLESGLSYIGLELEYGERRVAQFWANFEGSNTVTTIKYPEKYSLRSESERLNDANKLEEKADSISSITLKKEIAKEVAEMRMGSKISAETLDKINKEIDLANYIVFNTRTLYDDIENGLISPEAGSLIRGYGADEFKKAAIAHEERLTRIAIAQSKDGGLGKARGLGDFSDPDAGRKEKKDSRNTDNDPEIKDKTRGDGK